MQHDEQGLSRRRMVAIGALGGIGVGGVALAGASASPAAADGPADGPAEGPGVTTPQYADSEPKPPRIGSAPITSYTYLHCSFMDFHPYEGGSWVWTDKGVYTNGGDGGQMGATVDLPPGAVLRDVEFYYAATAAGSLDVSLWATGTSQFSPLVGGSAPATGGVLKARRLLVPLTKNGPYTLGGKLMLWAFTSPTFTVNGVRVGFSAAPTGAVLLPAPVRVYDSRTGGGTKIGNGQTRIHNLSTWVPPVATAAILNLSVTSGEKNGGMAVYNADGPVPSGSSLYFNGGTTLSNEVHSRLTADRRFKATMRGVAGSKCHYFVDLVGYTA